MSDFLISNYLWVKAFHLISLISWMAGLFYLPRLMVYHASAEKGSEQSETFKVMERKLLKIIMNPAMILTFITGILLLMTPSLVNFKAGWLHTKLTLVLAMAASHGIMAKNVRLFAIDANLKSHKYFRILNEVPTVLMIAIVILVVAKPF